MAIKGTRICSDISLLEELKKLNEYSAFGTDKAIYLDLKDASEQLNGDIGDKDIERFFGKADGKGVNREKGYILVNIIYKKLYLNGKEEELRTPDIVQKELNNSNKRLSELKQFFNLIICQVDKRIENYELSDDQILDMGEKEIKDFIEKTKKDEKVRIDQITERNLRQISKIDFVSYNNKGETICLNKEIYVKRDIEGKIVSTLKAEIGNLSKVYIIVGDPGNGKTSIVWNLVRKRKKLFSNIKVELHRAIDLQGRDSFVNILESKNKRLIIIDTIDILVNHRENLFYLIESIQKLFSNGNSILLTSRIQEADLLSESLSGINIEYFRLGNYSEKELEDAVNKYTKIYSTLSTQTNIDYDRIRDAAYNNYSIKEICQNPLTLKMLFSIYYPLEIYLEQINIKNLYSKYWDIKIQKEIRSEGEIINLDLTKTCELIAIIMYKENTPVIHIETAKINFYKKEIAFENVNELKKRGVLVINNEMVEFFHQTFYEYSASRFFTNREMYKNILEDTIQGDRIDQSKLKILEYSLIDGINSSPFNESSEIFKAFYSLIKGQSDIVKKEAILVYMMSLWSRKEKYFEVIEKELKRKKKVSLFFEFLKASSISDIDVLLSNIAMFKNDISFSDHNYILSYFMRFVKVYQNKSHFLDRIKELDLCGKVSLSDGKKFSNDFKLFFDILICLEHKDGDKLIIEFCTRNKSNITLQEKFVKYLSQKNEH